MLNGAYLQGMTKGENVNGKIREIVYYIKLLLELETKTWQSLNHMSMYFYYISKIYK